MMRKGPSYEINPALCIDDVDKTIEEVQRFKNAGGKTIIESQPCGCSRMTEELVHIGQSTKINLIAATGFHKLCFYPDKHWIHHLTEEALCNIFVNELTVGMYTDADEHLPKSMCHSKAGILKTALDSEGLSPRYQVLFRAAAKAALITNCIISIHIEQGTNPLQLLDFIMDIGMKPYHLMLCHMDRACKDIDIHKQLADKGVYLEYDTIGRFKYHSDEHEVAIFKEMIRSGFSKQLLFSLDTTRERLKSYNPNGIGLDYILTTFLPLLKDSGVTSKQLQWISHENCCRMLTD